VECSLLSPGPAVLDDDGAGVLHHGDRARAESDEVLLAGGELDELNSWVRKL